MVGAGRREKLRAYWMMNVIPPPLVTIGKARGMSWTARVARINTKRNAQLPGKEQTRITAKVTPK